MKKFFLVSFVFLLIGCRREHTYPDYKHLKGEWALAYILYRESGWPVDSFQTILPSDEYELDFRANPKYKYRKNNKCLESDKIYDFYFDRYSVGSYRGSYNAKTVSEKWLQFAVYSYDDVYDTIHTGQFGPYESGSGKYYDNYYVMDKD